MHLMWRPNRVVCSLRGSHLGMTVDPVEGGFGFSKRRRALKSEDMQLVGRRPIGWHTGHPGHGLLNCTWF